MNNKDKEIIEEFREKFKQRESTLFPNTHYIDNSAEEVEAFLLDALQKTRKATLEEVEKGFETMHHNHHAILRMECNVGHCDTFVETERAKKILEVYRLNSEKGDK